MFRLFGKRKYPSAAAVGWLRVGKWVSKKQVMIARILHVWLQRYSVAAQTSIVMSACLLCAVLSVWLFYQGVNGNHKHKKSTIDYSLEKTFKTDSIH